ncbi:MAG: hypothetical protein GPJ54_21845, partial [Candidatus Heimdallarchaeota archaeon]|nr:hypothetical protein [Candidatus Heimdallarchaeota archaeon]
IILVYTIGPDISKKRVIYMIIGIISAVMVGSLVIFIDIRSKFSDPNLLIADISLGTLTGFLEELFRYPFLIFAQAIALRLGKQKDGYKELKLKWTKVDDPHGIAIYFGVGWGMFETILYYIKPSYDSYINGEEWIFVDEIQPLSFRITGVMAHVALTYLALIITVNRSFYRFSITVHIGVNIANVIFTHIAANFIADVLFLLFSRFSLVVIVYYMLRPKVRYLTPALLLLFSVGLFLFFVLIGSLFYLISILIQTKIVN